MEEKVSEGLDILLSLHSKGILTMDELSDEARAVIHAQEMADQFLAREKETLKKMEEIRDPEVYAQYALQMTSVLPELLRRGSFPSAHAIAEVLARHSRTPHPLFTVRPSIAEKALLCFSEGSILAQLRAGFTSGKKESREEIGRLLLSLGTHAYGILIAILLESEDRWVRKHVCRLLVEMGRGIEDGLIRELRQKDRPWYFYRNIISVLGEMKSEKAGDAVSEFGFHPEPRLRMEVLDSLIKIFGKNADLILIDALNDQDVRVHTRAIDLLGTLRSANKRAILHFIEIIRKRDLEEEEPDEGLQMHVCLALESIGNRMVGEDQTLEDVLIESLRTEKTGVFRTKGTKRNKSPKVRLALCKTLGILGTEKSLDVLKSAAKEGDSSLKEKALEASDKISGRAAG